MNLVLFGLSEEANTKFHWCDVRDSGATASELDPKELGWIDPTRFWEVDRFEGLASDNAQANAAVFELVRSDEPPETLARLADFLRLPKTVRRILSEIDTSESPGLLAVANADRLASALPESVLGPILEAFEGAGCSLFVGSANPLPSVRARFARVVRVEGNSPRFWQNAALVLETGSSVSSLRPGERTELAAVPFAARVLRRANVPS
ncbi:MAG: hypothetical protein ACLQD8_05495 [Thermoplasmata archaeon]